MEIMTEIGNNMRILLDGNAFIFKQALLPPTPD